MVKIDIKDAYYHVRHVQRDLPYLCFEYKNVVYSHISLSMGASGSPVTFVKLMKPLIKRWRARGLRIVIYLDDILLLAPKETIVIQRDLLLEDLQTLGFVLNWEKSKTEPNQTQVFLGFQVESSPEPKILLPKLKRNALAHELERFGRNAPDRPKTKIAMRIAGLAVAASPVITVAESLIRPLLWEIGQEKDWEGTIQLSQKARRDILKLAEIVRERPSRLLNPRATIEIRSDATPRRVGMAIILNGQVLYTHQEWVSGSHINETELKAIVIAIERFGKIIRELGHKVVNICVDNTVSAVYCRRGTGRKKRLATLARKLVMTASHLGLTLLPEYLPGKENGLADLLSRYTNYKIQVPWLKENYLFPNPNPSVIFKAMEIAAPFQMILITPYWKGAAWFPALLTKTLRARRFLLPENPMGLQHNGGFVAWQISSDNRPIYPKKLGYYVSQIDQSLDWVEFSMN